MLNHLSELLQEDHLVKLVQKDNFMGWVYSIDYDTALVITNDLWKAKVQGVPHNSFLVAASFDPSEYHKVPEEDKEVILLRVIGSTKLPQDDDMIRTRIDNYQQQTGAFLDDPRKDFDDITKNMLQFGGLQCRVLGTFYVKDNDLWLGSDIESFAVSVRLNVYRPSGSALKTIVNYIDPIRKRKAQQDAEQLGLKGLVSPFPIGTVRYTSTDRLHRSSQEDLVEVVIQPSDFLARRTAVLGMTRTGKSNTIKQMVSVIKRISDDCDVRIGQIIYDINGEYANPNIQDEGAIYDIYKGDTVRYRMLETHGFEELQNNFYIQIQEGFQTIRRVIEEQADASAIDVQNFINATFDEPDFKDRSLYSRWAVKVAAYKAMLFRAGFKPPDNHRVRFTANQEIREAVNKKAGREIENPKNGLTLEEAVDWFLAAREANREKRLKSSGTDRKDWLDSDTAAILNMLAGLNQNNTYIKGYRVLTSAKKYHSPRRNKEVGDEIYNHLLDGKIVILDLSVGDATLREKIGKQIAQDIFNKSMDVFLKGDPPPNIVVYIEEAHNLIGRNMDLTETWPRLAKEGAKYRISLVYATQEVSSVHPNIMANTENWFVSHLNNEREIRELARFYDFSDFSKSLLRAQDVGFARVKTLSGPYVIPVQIDRFDPEAEKERVSELRAKKVSKQG